MQKYNRKTKVNINISEFINEENFGYELNKIKREDIIGFLKSKNADPSNLIEEKDEFIPYKYWDDFNNLNEMKLHNICRPVYYIANAWVKENYKKNHNILLICDPPKEWFFDGNIIQSDEYDILYNCQCLIPSTLTNLYPFRYMYWNKEEGGEFLDKCYNRNRMNNLLLFLLQFPYDKIIFKGSKEIYDYLKFYLDYNIEFIEEDPIKYKEIKDPITGKDKINISYPLNLYELDYKIDNPYDDEFFKYYWGKKKTIGNREKPTGISGSPRKNIGKDRDSIIKWTESEMNKWSPNYFGGMRGIRPIDKSGDSIFPRKYFPPTEDLQGEDLWRLGHPFWFITKQITLDHYKPKTKTMVIASCSNQKPYYDNPNYKYVRERYLEGYCDVFINSCELWPLGMCTDLFNRIYDWSHLRETPFVQGTLIDVNIGSILYEYYYFKFNKLILAAPWGNIRNPDDISGRMYPIIADTLKKLIPNFEIVMDEELASLLNYRSGNSDQAWGLVKTRFWGFNEFRKKFDDLIEYNGPNPTPIVSEEEKAKNKEEGARARQRKKERKLKGFGFVF